MLPLVSEMSYRIKEYLLCYCRINSVVGVTRACTQVTGTVSPNQTFNLYNTNNKVIKHFLSNNNNYLVEIDSEDRD